MKHFKFLLLLLCLCLFQGCAYEQPEYIHLKHKPTLNYYCNEIYGKILKGEKYTLELFVTDVYKTIAIDDSEAIIVTDFFSSLTNDSYLNYETIDSIEPYQFRITFNNGDKYLIRIYDKNKISVFPWDGVYEEDIVSMDKVPLRYNLYDYCTYIMNRSHYNQ